MITACITADHRSFTLHADSKVRNLLTKSSVFLANYDEVSKFAADAYGNFFHEHLQSWFEILDAEPSIQPIIQRLLSRANLQKLLADADSRA